MNSKRTKSPRIAFAFCPYFSLRNPHLGLSRVYTALRTAGFEADVFDFDVWLKTKDLHWYDKFQRANNIGLEFDRVSFVLGPEAILHSLYRDQFPKFDWRGVLSGGLIPTVDGFDEMVKEAAAFITANRYDYVLFSTYISNVLFSLSVAKEIKKSLQCRVVFGGPGCSLSETAEFVLKTGFVDAIVVGEGDETVCDLLENWSGRSEMPEIPGVASLRGDGFHFVPRTQIDDLDSLPRTMFPDADAAAHYLPIETSRGCSMRCGFCSESRYWDSFRMRSADSVVAEVAHYKTARPDDLPYVEFVDSLVNPTRERLSALAGGLKAAKLGVEWTCQMKPAKGLDREVAELAHDAGCRIVNLGAETFIPERLRYLRKGTRLEWIYDSIEALSAAGILTTVHRMSCIGGETDSEVLDMYDQLKEFKRRIGKKKQWSLIQWGAPDILRIEPYSPMFRNPEKWGIELSQFFIPLPEGLGHLRKSLDAISFKADTGMPREEKLRRHALIKKLDFVTGLVGS